MKFLFLPILGELKQFSCRFFINQIISKVLQRAIHLPICYCCMQSIFSNFFHKLRPHIHYRSQLQHEQKKKHLLFQNIILFLNILVTNWSNKNVPDDLQQIAFLFHQQTELFMKSQILLRYLLTCQACQIFSQTNQKNFSLTIMKINPIT